MGGLLGPGIESMSPALAGGFFTTEPPGKAKDVAVVVVVVVDHFLKSVLNLLQYCLFYVFGFLAMRQGVLGEVLSSPAMDQTCTP